MAGSRCLKGLFTGVRKADRPASYSGGEVGVQRLGKGVLAVTKATTDVRLDDPNRSPFNTKGLAHHPSNEVRDLGCTDDDDLSRFFVGEGVCWLDVAVRDNWGIVRASDLREAGLFNRFFEITNLIVCSSNYIIGALFMDWGKSGVVQGLFDI